MDPGTVDTIQRLARQDEELRRLWEQHRALEDEIGRLDGQRFRTPAEQMRRRELQKAKLAGRDRIQAILARAGQAHIDGRDGAEEERRAR